MPRSTKIYSKTVMAEGKTPTRQTVPALAFRLLHSYMTYYYRAIISELTSMLAWLSSLRWYPCWLGSHLPVDTHIVSCSTGSIWNGVPVATRPVQCLSMGLMVGQLNNHQSYVHCYSTLGRGYHVHRNHPIN